MLYCGGMTSSMYCFLCSHGNQSVCSSLTLHAESCGRRYEFAEPLHLRAASTDNAKPDSGQLTVMAMICWDDVELTSLRPAVADPNAPNDCPGEGPVLVSGGTKQRLSIP
eukprot:4815273-Amphidinium_carterae.1